MRANSFENLIADQKFKIQPADENISNYLLDCVSPFTDRSAMDLQINKEILNGSGGGLEVEIKKKPLHYKTALIIKF